MQKMTTPSIIPKVEAIDVVPNEDNKTLNKDDSTNGRSDTYYQRRTSSRKRAPKKFFGEVISPQQNQTPKRGRLSTIHLSQDLIDASGGKPKEVSPTLDDCEFENQPLSKWVEGMRSVPSTEPTPVNAAEQLLENQEKDQREIAVVLMEQRNLPFAKKNNLWKILEENDALKKIPQNPHFQPLEQVKEPLREGRAIGYMVNFADVFERISKLKFGDPRSVAEDFLEALAELETHGFNVRILKDRVVELVKVKGKEEKLLGEVKEHNSRIQGHYQERVKIGEEIGGIKEEIKKLEEKLSVSLSAKGKVENEIFALGERLNETEEGIENLRRWFEEGSSVFLCG